MTTVERYYQKVIVAIGVAMLAFLMLLELLKLALPHLADFLFLMIKDALLASVLYQLCHAVAYMMLFIPPSLILILSLRMQKTTLRPMYFSMRLSPYLPLIILATITISHAVSIFNAGLVNFFRLPQYPQEGALVTVAIPQAYTFVLTFLSSCLAPAFCEELLFRGAILTNCLPFGRDKAILISSLMFAMMHQNLLQFLYTFAGGILLGIVYVRTRSLWNVILLHLANNAFSVISNILRYGNGTVAGGSLSVVLFETVIYLLGVISIAILVFRFGGRREPLPDGAFGKEIPPHSGYAEHRVSARRSVTLFLHPVMIAFFGITLFRVVLTFFV